MIRLHPLPALAAPALAALLTLSTPARAQPAPPPAADDAAQVNQHYEEGLKAAKQNQWPQARDAFLRAWKLKAHYQIAANLGRAELMTGAYRDAAEHLAYFLREAPADVSAEDRAQALKWLAEAKAKIGTVTVKVEPPGAEVLVDGARQPDPLPAELYVEPGKRVIEARRQGHVAARRELDVGPGQAQAVDLRLEAERAAAPPPSSLPGEPPSRSPLLIGVGVGTTFAAAAAGGVLMVMAAVRAGEQSKLCPDRGAPTCAPDTGLEWLSLEKSRIDFLNMGIASFIGAGALGAATVIYALTGSRQEDPPRAGQIRVHVAPGGAGVSGRF